MGSPAADTPITGEFIMLAIICGFIFGSAWYWLVKERVKFRKAENDYRAGLYMHRSKFIADRNDAELGCALALGIMCGAVFIFVFNLYIGA
ncbi:hypothetical protein AMP2_gp069 [Pseudomonas phage vB_Pae_AM.P2]|uniref:Uncharacterized protein n=1 Tax=Pseudomonas phage vB_Pae_AM.P2 TaxID=2731695 RepID=A0A7S6B6E7_9CAUD|nr:hypothetical protein AMP2_gp069 [Pseudomonas phage vB_Pae_AM.P2]